MHQHFNLQFVLIGISVPRKCIEFHWNKFELQLEALFSQNYKTYNEFLWTLKIMFFLPIYHSSAETENIGYVSHLNRPLAASGWENKYSSKITTIKFDKLSQPLANLCCKFLKYGLKLNFFWLGTCSQHKVHIYWISSDTLTKSFKFFLTNLKFNFSNKFLGSRSRRIHSKCNCYT